MIYKPAEKIILELRSVLWLARGGGGGGGHSGTEGGRTRVTYFAKEGVFI